MLGTLAATTALATAGRAADVVTVYSADGLHDGSPNWYETQFDAFTQATGIRVQYIEGGSGSIVARVAREASNPQADVLVTLPPYIQKAAAGGFLERSVPAEASFVPRALRDRDGRYVAIVGNYLDFIYDTSSHKGKPRTFMDFLDRRYREKIQYSTPGQAGDGTAVMLEIFHAFGSKDAGFDYLKRLQENNVGPSSSTGKLAALVDKGELAIANGDLQMNGAQLLRNPNVEIFFPAGPNGRRSTLALPYFAGIVCGAPHAQAGKKLIAFLLSKAAQATVSSIGMGFPVRSDVVPVDATFRRLQRALRGLTVWTPDWRRVVDELPADVARWHDVTES